jgi:CheY-like chemotaxis protein
MGTEARPNGRVILLADDDREYQTLVQFALDDLPISTTLFWVTDGGELLDFLRGCGKYSGAALAPRPDHILLDLNMPRMDGREALRELRADAALRGIPVTVMSTSDIEEDQSLAYELGANAFLTKSASFSGLVQIMKDLLK